jgi:hypothetical protein
MIIGTASYMSPEQAKGKPVDARSDIFSFGVVLYEMLTGKQPFEGENAMDVIGSILNKEPTPIQQLIPEVPQEIGRISSKTLKKDREERYQTAKDLLIDLKDVKQDLELQNKLERTSSPNREEPKTQILSATTSDAAHTTSSAEYVVSEIKRNKRGVGIAIVAFLLTIGVIGFGLYLFWGKTNKPSQSIKIERLTTNGKSVNAAISPDSKYVVYSVDEGGGESLWVRQVTASSNVQIIPPAEDVYYEGITFTPDSNYINFVKAEYEKNVDALLYQMPVLGGTQKKLITNAEGGVSYSPDGKQFAFFRSNYPNMGESALFIANTDGTEERILASRKTPETFPSRERSPAWSPDGKTIACIVETATGIGRMDVVEVNVADGSSKTVVTKEWEEINQIAWLPDKSGLLVLGVEKGSVNYSRQIWRFSYPEGEAQRITTDFNNYASMSLPSDSNALVTVQSNRISNIWVAASFNSSAFAFCILCGSTSFANPKSKIFA